MRKQKVLCIFLSVVITIFMFPSAIFAASAITLSLDDNTLTSDAAPVIKDGRTLVPIRVITENLNCNVSWDAASKTVSITEKDGSSLKLVIGSKEGEKTGKDGTVNTFTMDVPASIINGRTMVPIRAITDNLSSAPQIGWSNALRKVCIYTPDYLSEKGITDLNAYVAGFKAPPKDATGVTDLGQLHMVLDNIGSRDCHVIKVNGNYYINAYDYLSKWEYTSSDTTVQYNKGIDYIEKVESYSYAPDYSLGNSSYPLSKYLTETKNIETHNKFTVGEYAPTQEICTTTNLKCSIRPDETVSNEDAGMDHYYDDYSEAGYSQKDIFENYINHLTDISRDKWKSIDDSTIASEKVENYTKKNYTRPIVMYNNEVYLPLGEYLTLGGYEYTLNGKTLHGTIISEKPAATPAPAPANPIPAQPKIINVGDTVYATAVFFKCWGTVQQVSGSKAQVQWSQVTDMYGMLVNPDAYASEIDILSQSSMSVKGIMMGTSTWVEVSELYKK